MPAKAGIQFLALGPRFRGDERNVSSICTLREYRLDRFFPRSVISLQQHLRRRRAARDDLLHRFEIMRLVAVIAVAEIAPLQPRLAQCEAFLREIEHHAPADLRRKPGARYVIAQLLPLLGTPVL